MEIYIRNKIIWKRHSITCLFSNKRKRRYEKPSYYYLLIQHKPKFNTCNTKLISNMEPKLFSNEISPTSFRPSFDYKMTPWRSLKQMRMKQTSEKQAQEPWSWWNPKNSTCSEIRELLIEETIGFFAITRLLLNQEQQLHNKTLGRRWISL